MANLVSIKTCKNDDQSGLKPMTQWRPIDGVISNWCQPGYDRIGKMCSVWLHKWALSAVWRLITLSLSPIRGPSHRSSHQTVSHCHGVSRESRDTVTLSVMSPICNISYQIIQSLKMFSPSLWIDFINLWYHLIPLSSAIVQFLSV